MSRTKPLEWFKFEPYQSIGIFQTSSNDHDDYLCPTCGDPCVYNEGMIEQDEQGNDISGWWFECHSCAIYCEHTQGSWSSEFDG